MKARVPLLTAVTTLAGAILAARRGQDDIRGEVAVVTGASRGLGLLLARELARHSCPLVICARDAAELDRAAGQLREAGAEVTAVVCDITDEASPRLLVDTAIERYGRLDILISNAGIIQVGPVQDGQAGLFETALDTMALAPVRLALTGLPVMRRQGHGRIVTIASVGGKLSVPHLLPYSTAKFAAVGFSEGLRAELGRGPVTVTTVVPGLMRTGSHLQARFTGQAGKEFTWFALGASLPLVSMDAERAARQIIGAVRQRRAEVILTPAAQLVSRAAGLAPGLTSEVLHLVQRLALPAPPGQAAQGGEPVPGHELNPALPRNAFDRLTTLGRAAASRFNERSQLSGGIMTRADTARDGGPSLVDCIAESSRDRFEAVTGGRRFGRVGSSARPPSPAGGDNIGQREG
jgi:short-subunit dehydrogenase